MVPKILSGYFKNKTQEVPKILSNCFKNKTQVISEIFSNYFKNKSHRGFLRFFQTTYFKNKTQGILGILSNFFKNHIQGVSLILSNYFKNTATGGPRDCFKLHTSKTKHKEFPRFFKITYFKNKSHRRLSRFLQTTSK